MIQDYALNVLLWRPLERLDHLATQTDSNRLPRLKTPPPQTSGVAHHSMGLVFCGSTCKITVLVHTEFQRLHIPPVCESQVMGNHCGIG